MKVKQKISGLSNEWQLVLGVVLALALFGLVMGCVALLTSLNHTQDAEILRQIGFDAAPLIAIILIGVGAIYFHLKKLPGVGLGMIIAGILPLIVLFSCMASLGR